MLTDLKTKLRNIKKVDVIYALVLSVLIALGIDYSVRHGSSDLSLNIFVIFLLVLIPVYFNLQVLYHFHKLIKEEIVIENRSEKMARYYPFVFFFVIWLIFFIFFLNNYPGSLNSDLLGSVWVGVNKVSMENVNPFIVNCLISLAMHIGYPIASYYGGLAAYTIIQMTIYALVEAYFIKTLLDKKFNIIVVFLVSLFFINPVNIVYATGMWKDALFAILFLLTLTYAFNLIVSKTEITKAQIIKFVLITLVCSLSRNSGWSSLGIGSVALLIYAIRNKKKQVKKVALWQLISVGLAILTMLCIYPLFGIQTSDTYMAVSIPMQQISRTVIDDELNDYEKEEISYFIRADHSIEGITEVYDEYLVDPLRDIYDFEVIGKETPRFYKLYFELFFNHPKTFTNALVDHTANFWWPQAGSWLWDLRIEENNLGLVNSPLLMKETVLPKLYLKYFNKIPFLKYVYNAGMAFFVWLLCTYLCLKDENKLGAVLCVPAIAVYILLMLTAFAGYYRYIYGAVLVVPLTILFLHLKDIIKEV